MPKPTQSQRFQIPYDPSYVINFIYSSPSFLFQNNDHPKNLSFLSPKTCDSCQKHPIIGCSNGFRQTVIPSIKDLNLQIIKSGRAANYPRLRAVYQYIEYLESCNLVQRNIFTYNLYLDALLRCYKKSVDSVHISTAERRERDTASQNSRSSQNDINRGVDSSHLNYGDANLQNLQDFMQRNEHQTLDTSIAASTYAEQVVREMHAVSHIRPDLFTLNTALKSCGIHNAVDVQKAEQWYNTILEQASRSPRDNMNQNQFQDNGSQTKNMKFQSGYRSLSNYPSASSSGDNQPDYLVGLDIHGPDVVTINTMMNIYAAAENWAGVRIIWDQMNKNGLIPDEYSIATRSKACRTCEHAPQVDALLYLYEQGLKMSPFENSNGIHYENENRARSKHNKGRFYGKLKSHSLRNPVVFHSLASAYIRCGQPQKALIVFERLRSYETFQFDVHCFNITWKAKVEMGTITTEQAHREFDSFFLESNREPDVATFLYLAEIYNRNGSLVNVNDVIYLMMERNVAYVPVYNYFVQALGQNRFKPVAIDNVFNLLLEAQRRGILVDRIKAQTFTILIDAYASYGLFEKSLVIFKQTLQDSSLGDHHIILNALLKCGRSAMLNNILSGKRGENIKILTEIDMIFDEIKSAGERSLIHPDMITYNTLIDVFILSKDLDGARNVVEIMKNRGLEPDQTTYNTLLKGMVYSKKNLAKTQEVISIMKRNRFMRDSYTYQALLKMYAMQGDVQLAEKVFSTLLKYCQRQGENKFPHVSAFTCLMKAYASKELPEAERILHIGEIMKGYGIDLDLSAMLLVAHTHARRGDCLKVKQLLERIRNTDDNDRLNQGRLQTILSYIEMKSHFQVGDIQTSLEVLKTSPAPDFLLFKYALETVIQRGTSSQLVTVVQLYEERGLRQTESDEKTRMLLNKVLQRVKGVLSSMDVGLKQRLRILVEKLAGRGVKNGTLKENETRGD